MLQSWMAFPHLKRNKQQHRRLSLSVDVLVLSIYCPWQANMQNVQNLLIPGCTTALWQVVFVMCVSFHRDVCCSDTQMTRRCCCCCCCCSRRKCDHWSIWPPRHWAIRLFSVQKNSTLTHRKDTMWHSHSVQSAVCRIVCTEGEAKTRPEFKTLNIDAPWRDYFCWSSCASFPSSSAQHLHLQIRSL